MKIALDPLNPTKAENQADILEKFCSLRGKKVLEIGSGLGVNHIVWTRKYGIDGYGVEPSEVGFDSSFAISRRLITLNGLDASRIVSAFGEELPFPGSSFDIVYSTNVLEHTQRPEAVVREAFRVLRPGGVMQLVYPNYHSYFDGHYAVFHPPVFSRGFFPWYVKTIFRRDPGFARTLRTELNVPWTKRVLTNLRELGEFELLSLGVDTFLARMSTQNFQAWAGLTKVAAVLGIVNRLGLSKVAARGIVLAKGFTPIILTLQKRG